MMWRKHWSCLQARHVAAKISECKQAIELKAYAMSLI
jgi:hypothetical protein